MIIERANLIKKTVKERCHILADIKTFSQTRSKCFCFDNTLRIFFNRYVNESGEKAAAQKIFSQSVIVLKWCFIKLKAAC